MSDSPSKQLKKDDLSWFKLSNYEASKTMSLAGWSAALYFRYLLRAFVERATGEPMLDGIYVKLLELILHSPLIVEIASRSSAFIAKGHPRVWDVYVDDVFCGGRSRLEDPRYADAREQADEWNKRLDQESFPPKGDFPLLNMSFDDYIASKGLSNGSLQEIIVDLNASDSQLINDFKQWLARKREVRSIYTFDKPLTENDARQWARYHVLAYIDLQLFCSYTGTKLTQWDIGNRLFPNENINPTERIRKVVKPKAEELLNRNFIDALDQQVAAAEQKND